MKTRVLYLLDKYPQLSETYVSSEIAAIKGDYEIKIMAMKPADTAAVQHERFSIFKGSTAVALAIHQFKPHVIHTHFLHCAQIVDGISRQTGIPYTVRAHSFDALSREEKLSIGETCLGMLAFPFSRERLIGLGVPEGKIIDCSSVVNFDRFYDRSPNGDAILNMGAARTKKKFEDFVDLANLVPDKTFNLYSIGYASDTIIEYNKAHGGRVNILSTVQHEEMPAVYKRHGWLVYTACPVQKTVGWPMSIAEAQASGLGVCVPRIRPDMEQYVGGAGFLYDSINEVPALISKPYPEEMRELGFEQARKSDIRRHKKLLTDLWDGCNKG